MMKIETERLLLTPLTMNNIADVYKLFSLPIVNKYLWDPLYKDIDEAQKLIITCEKNWENNKNYSFGVFLKENGAFIGTCGIGPDNEKEWGVGYSLIPDSWGEGYATELLSSIVDFAYQLGARVITGEVAIANPASGRVLEKCGFQIHSHASFTKYDQTATYPSKVYKMHLK